MAEGDTVFATAARLHRAIAGHVLTATDLRVPRYATADLSGQIVREVGARGKRPSLSHVERPQPMRGGTPSVSRKNASVRVQDRSAAALL